MKNILFVGMTPNKGGIETYMMNIFLKLEGHGFHFDFVNTYGKRLAYSNLIRKRGGIIKDIYIPNNIKRHFIRNKMIKKLLSSSKSHYDVMHVNALSINSMCWIKLANKFHIKTLIIQSHISDVTNNNSLMRKCISLILALFNRIYLSTHRSIIELAASDNAGKWMFRNDRFHVIPNGVDTNRFIYNKSVDYYVRHKLHIKITDKVLITVARLSYQKNYRKIIYIFNEIHKLNKHIILVIVGDGPERSYIVNLISKLNLNRYIRFLGSINNVYNILNIANLMLMPSRFEGFPFALVEAQSSGVPALVSQTVIPKASNITGHLQYISLNRTNLYWAKKAIYMIGHSPNSKERYRMNDMVKCSQYSISNLIKNIKIIYK